MSDLERRRFQIGYALAPKKEQSFIKTSLVDLAKQRGIDLVRIDANTPLIEQGPFDCVIHKLCGEDWKKQLEEFKFKNPNVAIIDPPDAIERLHNRISMLQAVTELKLPQENETFGVPNQVVIYKSDALLSDVGELKFPVIAKPLVADGSAKSHNMSLVFNQEGFRKLKPPIVLQEFVNHGGVIFKVYVVGEYVKCVKRRSLADVSEDNLGTLEGVLSFSQISNLTTQQSDGGGGDDYNDMLHCVEEAEMPPLSFVTDIANGLRRAMGLRLFNFDVIRDVSVGNRYLVIDINYFPGYAKMPSYETVLTDFFWDIVHRKRTGDMKGSQESGSDCRKMGTNTCSSDGDDSSSLS